jgi:succinate dehydrogenase / fumarate reductase cytochrome b subunit
MKNRPTSPHLGIYKIMITSSSSILGRLAGIYTYILAVIIFILAAFQIQNYKDISAILTAIFNFQSAGLLQNVLVMLFVFGSLFAFFLYILSLIRHLIWDFGYLQDLKPSKIMGYGMFILAFTISIVLTFYMFFI